MKQSYVIIGKGPFEGIEGKTTANSENQAIRNIAFRKGIDWDDYFYFKSNVEVKIVPKTMIAKISPNGTNTNFVKWMKRRKD